MPSIDPEPFGRLRVFVVTPLLSPPVGKAAGAMASLSVEVLEALDEEDDFGRGVASSLVGRFVCNNRSGVGRSGAAGGRAGRRGLRGSSIRTYAWSTLRYTLRFRVAGLRGTDRRQDVLTVCSLHVSNENARRNSRRGDTE
ncbi:MAG: hypothetical protein QM784_35295 [Polyangiaceae bacterium]